MSLIPIYVALSHRSEREEQRRMYAHTRSLEGCFFQCCVSFALSCISGCKQWNHSPHSQSLIRRRIWGEWELTCEQRSADCDYSAVGALNRCRLCLPLPSRGAAQLPGHSGAEEPAAAADNISLHFSVDLGLLFIGLLSTKLLLCWGHLANITCWGFSC